MEEDKVAPEIQEHEEKEKRAEYAKLISEGLSDSEARGTVWPEPGEGEKPKGEFEPYEEYIEIIKSGKPRRTKTRVVWIDWPVKEGDKWIDKKEKVVIKKLTYGERADFMEKYLTFEMAGQMPKTDLKLKNISMYTLLMCLHEAPFPITEDYLQNELDGEPGDILYFECDTFNKLTESQKKKLSGQSKKDQ